VSRIDHEEIEQTRAILIDVLSSKYQVSADEPLALKIFLWEAAGVANSDPFKIEQRNQCLKLASEYPKLTLEFVYLQDLGGYHHRHVLQIGCARLFRGSTQVECVELFVRFRDQCRIGIGWRVNSLTLSLKGLTPSKMPAGWQDWEWETFDGWYRDTYLYACYYEYKDSQGRMYGPWPGGVSSLLCNFAPIPLLVEGRCAGDSSWHHPNRIPNHRPPDRLKLPSTESMKRELYRLVSFLVAEWLVAELRPVATDIPHWVRGFLDLGFVASQFDQNDSIILHLVSGNYAELLVRATRIKAEETLEQARDRMRFEDGAFPDIELIDWTTPHSPFPLAKTKRTFTVVKPGKRYSQTHQMLDWYGCLSAGDQLVQVKYTHMECNLPIEESRIVESLLHLRRHFLSI
jgi:hypothetical protein